MSEPCRCVVCGAPCATELTFRGSIPQGSRPRLHGTYTEHMCATLGHTWVEEFKPSPEHQAEMSAELGEPPPSEK